MASEPLPPELFAKLETVDVAWRAREAARKAVLDWMDAEAVKLNLVRACQAPMWSEYEAAEEAWKLALGAFTSIDVLPKLVETIADLRDQLHESRTINRTTWRDNAIRETAEAIATWLDAKAARLEATLASIPDNEHNRERRDEFGWGASYTAGAAADVRGGAWRKP